MARSANRLPILLIPEAGVALDRESAFIGSIFNGGKKNGYDVENYFYVGDKNGKIFICHSDRKVLQKSWNNIAEKIMNKYIISDEKSADSSMPEKTNDVGFAKIGSPLLRQILGEK